MFSRAFIRGVACSRVPLVRKHAPIRLLLSSAYSPIAVAQPFRAVVGSFRAYSSDNDAPTADEIVEELQELYATAKDEFEIAQEETEKVSVYAEDDRSAAREELNKLEAAFQAAVKQSAPEVAQEVQRRVGQRVRELANAVKNMEELAQNQD